LDIEKVARNTKLLMNSSPFNVEEIEFVKPGKGSAIYKLKLRNLLNNSLQEITYRSAAKVEETTVTTHDMQYLYQEGENFVFMDSQSFEQFMVPQERVGNKKYYLKDGLLVTVVMWGTEPIDINLPITIELKVVETGSGSKTDTVTAQAKTAKTDTGMTLGVPSFVKEGDTIKVDTRSGQYLERIGR
jgi:elongation factor P